MRNDRDRELLNATVNPLPNDPPRLEPVPPPDNWEIDGIRGVELKADSLLFPTDSEGFLLQDSPTEINLTAVRKAITGDPVFEVTKGEATLVDGTSITQKILKFENLVTDTVTIKVSVENTSTFKPYGNEPNRTYTDELVLSKVAQGKDGLDGADGADGADGLTARAVNLIASDQTIEYSAAGLEPNPATVEFTAGAHNTGEAVVFYQFYVNDVRVQSSTENVFTYSAPESFDGLPAKVEVQIREHSDGGNIVARDQVTVFGLKEGSDGLTVVLSNEAHVVPADNLGNPTFLNGSGTFIEVWQGATQLSYLEGAGEIGTFSVAATGTNIGVGAAWTVGKSRAYGNITSFTDDHGSVLYTITLTGVDGETRTIEKTQTYSKSKSGKDGVNGADGADGSDGVSARAVDLTATGQTINYNAAGSVPYPASLGITATARNTKGTVYYQFFVNDVQVQSSTLNIFTFNSPVAFDSLPAKIEVQIRENDPNSEILARDQLTVFGLKEGSDGITVTLSNEAHTIPTSYTGSVLSFANSGTRIDVWQGAAQLSYNASHSSPGTYSVTAAGAQVTVGGASTSGKTRVYGNISGFTADTGTITFTVNVRGLDNKVKTFTKVQSFSKSKAGKDGTDGLDGQLGPRTATGYMYYQLSRSSAPSKPSASSFNFSTGYFGSHTSNWAETPPTFQAGNSNKYWYVFYTVRESSYGGSQTVTISNPIQGIGFSGLVTFSGSTLTNGTTGFDYTQIDGGWIKTGQMSADRIGAGRLMIEDTASSASSFYHPEFGALMTPFALLATRTSSHVGLYVNKTGSTGNGTAIYGQAESSSNSDAGIAGTNFNPATRKTFGLVGWHYSTTDGSIGTAGYTYSSTDNSAGGEFRAPYGGVGLRITSGRLEIGNYNASIGGAIFLNDTIGAQYRIDSMGGALRFFKRGYDSTGVSIYQNGSIQAPGGVNPFTGAHIAIVDFENYEIGDIVLDTDHVYKIDVSNAITEVVLSTAPMQKSAVGVIAKPAEEIPLLPPKEPYVVDVPVSPKNDTTTTAYVDVGRGAESYGLSDDVIDHLRGLGKKWTTVNALGEGQINVCGEGGDLEIGDLIVTSSMSGKGMKQADDVIRNYTVAKCRETVTFASPDEVKQVACIYLCG